MINIRTHAWDWGLLLVVMTCAVYSYTTRCGWIWDDPSYVTDNVTLKEPSGLSRIWLEQGANAQYYPMVFTTFWIEYQLWGLEPFGYHVVNVLLHALTAVLWWRLLLQLGVPGAWMAAAVFALHPVHVESVAWVTERKNVLSGVFYVSALLAWLRYCPLHIDLPNKQRNWRAYAAAMLLYVCALLSKSVTATLPAAIMLGLWWQRPKLRAISMRDLAALAPMLLIGLCFGLNTLWLEKHHVGAQGAEWDYTLVERFLIAGRVLWFYAGKLAWPAELIFIYPRWEINSVQVVQWVYPIGALLVMTILWLKQERIGRGPLVGVLFFAGSLAPALGFFNVFPMRYSFVADHFQYLASMGLIALATAALTQLFKTVKPAGIIAAVVLLSALGVRSWAQTHQYKNEQVLWETTIELNPKASIAYNNLGAIYDRQQRFNKAILYYEKALELNPTRAESYHNIAEVYRQRGDMKSAVPFYRDAVKRLSTYAPMRMSLAIALHQTGDLENAIAEYEAAIQLNPNFVEAHELLADAYAEQKRFKEAIPHYLRVLETDRKNINLMAKVAQLMIMTGQGREAVGIYEYLLQHRPDEPKVLQGMALALASIGHEKQARQILAKLLKDDPGSPEALKLLALIHAAKGETDQAIELATKAILSAKDRGNEKLSQSIQKQLEQYRMTKQSP